ncbi:N-acetylglutaminylglutamine synthetase [Aureimonas ureilytica]|uniref:N-acetylglutaminylglutamine synthetase n=1 Tax=Aureimonas ureilytica TaxID=401562 RepID=UPI000372F110|nr:N-acetylglutaminylglutamine synthetase [Aureimonas ureilytica]
MVQASDPAGPAADVSLDCGWGRLCFAQTFADPAHLARSLEEEGPARRDIAFYVSEPHVLLAQAPIDLFLDPSHTYRLDLDALKPSLRSPAGFRIRPIERESDAAAINRIYRVRNMVEVDPGFLWSHREGSALTYLVAEDERTGAVIGTVTGVDHVAAFGDPDNGTSLWCLAIDAQAVYPGLGEALVRGLAGRFHKAGRRTLDLSVMHDNAAAIGLYERLGFHRLPTFAVKRRNPINERLFTGTPSADEALNPYARIIVDEARRRGIHAELLDAKGGFFRLTYGGRSLRCRESLSDLTSAVALSICDDKSVTRRLVADAGVVVPEQIVAGDEAELQAFLDSHGQIVVKPARGEQGRGISVGLSTLEDAKAAIETARRECDRVLVESCFQGRDLRLVVIDFRLVAAAIREPPAVTGNGSDTVRELIEQLSRRRQSATSGESTVPLDAETERTVRAAGFAMDAVLPEGERLTVRRTANLHTGGTIHDVTDIVHPRLVEAAVAAARAIDIPVCGIDLMVEDPSREPYVFIEANERPGLANHEPQPTAERFIDLLFPLSIPASARTARLKRRLD